MSSFLPEGGCYELLTIIGNVQGLPRPWSSRGRAAAASPHCHECVPEAVGYLEEGQW